ncbi:hypothetical protein, partial [Yersinia aleksiciae]|uniref:hypothetical protein n=1 Tax=Yersinia aleksiciae TaxID=263819 RepID=UPI001C98C56E
MTSHNMSTGSHAITDRCQFWDYWCWPYQIDTATVTYYPSQQCRVMSVFLTLHFSVISVFDMFKIGIGPS